MSDNTEEKPIPWIIHIQSEKEQKLFLWQQDFAPDNKEALKCAMQESKANLISECAASAGEDTLFVCLSYWCGDEKDMATMAENFLERGALMYFEGPLYRRIEDFSLSSTLRDIPHGLALQVMSFGHQMEFIAQEASSILFRQKMMGEGWAEDKTTPSRCKI